MTDFEPFDLARAEAGEPVMFRDCTDKVEFKCALHDADGSVRSLLFVRTSSDGFELELTRHPDGMFAGVDVYSPLDIVMRPKPPITKKYWVGLELYGDGNVKQSWVTPFPPITQWQHVIEIEVILPPTKR